MNEKISLEFLNVNSVSILKQKVTTVDNIEYPLGERWNKQYCNSPKGRILLEQEVTEPYKTAILSVWGDNPTIKDITE